MSRGFNSNDRGFSHRRVEVTGVNEDGSKVVVRDGLGWGTTLDGRYRVKGTPLPQEGEIWLIERIGNGWLLRAMVDATEPEIPDPVNPVPEWVFEFPDRPGFADTPQWVLDMPEAPEIPDVPQWVLDMPDPPDIPDVPQWVLEMPDPPVSWEPPAWQTWPIAITTAGLGTQPSWGNSVRNARYMQVGDAVTVQIDIQFGSTFSPGGGFYMLSLPVPAASNRHQPLTLHAADLGAAETQRPGTAKIEGGNAIARMYASDNGALSGARTLGTSAQSLTPSSGTRLIIGGTYQAASNSPGRGSIEG